MKKIIKRILFLFAIVILFIGMLFGVLYIVAYNRHQKEIKEEKKYIREWEINDSIQCRCDIEKAYEYIRRGEVFVNWDTFLYAPEIVYKDYHLYAAFFPEHMQVIFDSVLFARYGDDFYDKLGKKSDSLRRMEPSVDLDGYRTYAVNRPEYKCGDVYSYIEDSLFSLNLLPLKQSKCLPNTLILDAVITQTGQLTDIRVLMRINPEIDSAIISILNNLPCDWIPANDGNEDETFNFRRTFYFFFEKHLE